MTALLVDGDILVYRHAFAEQVEVDMGGGGVASWAELEPAWAGVVAEVKSLAVAAGCDAVRVTLSCPSDQCFRRDVDPAYKHNRRGQSRPLLYSRLRDRMLLGCEDFPPATALPRLEGDDVLGLLATGRAWRGRCVIATIDKDLRGIPGRHVLLGGAAEESTVIAVVDRDAEHFFLTQCLTGDLVDGFGGCPGVGPVRAAKILAGVDEGPGWVRSAFEDLVVPAYVKAGLGREAALQTARLARILRRGDYRHRTGKVRLWAPTKEERRWL